MRLMLHCVFATALRQVSQSMTWEAYGTCQAVGLLDMCCEPLSYHIDNNVKHKPWHGCAEWLQRCYKHGTSSQNRGLSSPPHGSPGARVALHAPPEPALLSSTA